MACVADDSDASTTSSKPSALQISADMDMMQVTTSTFTYENRQFERPNRRIGDYSSDVRLKCDGLVLQTHRDVLAAGSPYFAAMFGSAGMREREATEVQLQELAVDGVQLMVEYLYRGRVTLDSQVIGSAVEAARFFQVDWLLRAAVSFMTHCLAFHDYNWALELAERFSLPEVAAEGVAYLGGQFSALLKSGDIPDRLCNEAFHDLLRSDVFIDVTEADLLDVILEGWSEKGDLSERENLLSELRLDLLDSDSLSRLSSLELHSAALNRAVEKAHKNSQNPQAACLQQPPSLGRGSRPFLVSFEVDEHQHALTCIQPDTGLCLGVRLDTTPLAIYLENASSEVIGNFLFVVGGYTENYSASASTFALDARDLSWVLCAAMSEPRVAAAVTSDGHRLYVVGGVDHSYCRETGRDTEEVFSSAEVYHPETNTWSPLPTLPKGVHSAAAACLPDGRLCISGGVSDNLEDDIPLAECWLLESDNWRPLPPMNIPRQNHTLFAWKGHLFAVGGMACSEDRQTLEPCLSVEMLPEGDHTSWEMLQSAPEHWGQLTNKHTLLGDCLYICAGELGERVLRAFHLPTREWLEGIGEVVGVSCSHLAYLNMTLKP